MQPPPRLALVITEHAQQEVFGADILVPEIVRLLDGSVESQFGRVGEGDLLRTAA